MEASKADDDLEGMFPTNRFGLAPLKQEGKAVPFDLPAGTDAWTENPFAERLDGVTEKELSEPVFDTPVATLLDLWVNKYGNAWIDTTEIERDPFYSIAYMRLKALGELEVHYLTDRSKYVCRKPPK
jgi:hypothetical protein